MDSAETIKSDAASIPSDSTTSRVHTDILQIARTAAARIQQASSPDRPDEEAFGFENISLLADGGYNSVWLVKTCERFRFVLRIPKEDSLFPHQLNNEVAFLSFIAAKCAEIPVPKVHAFDTGPNDSGMAFIAEEYIDALPLAAVWMSYTEEQKSVVARQIAKLIVKLAETTFEGIGGLTLDHKLGPTIEGAKIFKGRRFFYSADCYAIGPYSSSKDYVLACYDREIYYYTHAPANMIDHDLFVETSVEDFIEQLRRTRQSIANDEHAFLPEEPFVLVHGDLTGRNIMVKGIDIVALLDWEFAGAYPLSELWDGQGLDLVEPESDETVEESWKWSDKILELVEGIARGSDWTERNLELLLGGGNPALQAARVEMFP